MIVTRGSLKRSVKRSPTPTCRSSVCPRGRRTSTRTRSDSCEPSRNHVWIGSCSSGKHRSDERCVSSRISCHQERNHQGLGNQLIVPLAEQPNYDGHIACRERLGGLLKYYHRAAA